MSDFRFSLVLPKSIIEEILKRASSSPVEICGFLLGRGNEVSEVVFIKNRLDSPVEFEMEPEEMLRALEYAENRGLEILAIFHSHLSCLPTPSGKDLRGMNLWPVVWLIVNSSGKYKAWKLENGKVVEVEVKIVNRSS
ncbi:Mov34/MPN/PAD-1 family protein [Thermococcus chitonophagus]|uniref:Proteasome-associated protease Rpn11 n=1 Tax=Thermococcus chitonophagus TaxID=54262 RepID=A0A160VRN4_9EURY|nr:M67 family metallopeptidase [Thermococcus chitonophagus]CUX77663.1 Proteasome-associated protease Rpn11 [Thermococcus chitonophagus]